MLVSDAISTENILIKEHAVAVAGSGILFAKVGIGIGLNCEAPLALSQ